MRKRNILVYLALAALVFFGASSPAVANKSAVDIDVPKSAVVGDEITIRLNVTHSANNFFHYTKRVNVVVNGSEIKRWKYGSFDRPEGKDFSREITYTVTTLPLEIVAEAYCNIHGSSGQATATVSTR
jgi:desulfoferrodoxin (superoxide reductase-like protein)